MNEADQAQSETPPVILDVSRRLFYAPWMIGVLVVFVVCEVLFFTWGYEAARSAIFGLLLAMVFGVIRYCRVTEVVSSCWGFLGFGILIFLLLQMLLLPAVQFSREAACRLSCANKLKQLGFGIHCYASEYNKLPPVFVADEAGRPMHSWRTLVLPFLEMDELYDRYDFQKPWDSPENQALGADKKLGYVMRCPSVDDSGRPIHRTDYVAVVGDDTIWPTDGTSRLLKDITAGTSNAGMLIEINNSDISWNEPRDVKLADLLSGKVSWNQTAPHSPYSAFNHPAVGRNVLMADGSFRYLYDLTPDQIRRLFSITEPFDVDKERSYPVSQPIRYRYVVFYVWLATLFLQFLYIFFPIEKKIKRAVA